MITSTKQPACPVCDPPTLTAQLSATPSMVLERLQTHKFLPSAELERPKFWLFRVVCVFDPESGASVIVGTKPTILLHLNALH